MSLSLRVKPQTQPPNDQALSTEVKETEVPGLCSLWGWESKFWTEVPPIFSFSWGPIFTHPGSWLLLATILSLPHSFQS